MDTYTFWRKRKCYRVVALAGMNFQNSVICKKIKNQEKGLKQLFDPPERIVVEMVGGNDRPPGSKGLQAQRASRPEGPPGLKGLQALGASRPEGPLGPLIHLKGLQPQGDSCPKGPPGPLIHLKGLLPRGASYPEGPPGPQGLQACRASRPAGP